MGFDSLFDKIEPTGFGLNSMALPRRWEQEIIGYLNVVPPSTTSV